jgi:hypothetical protein
MAKEEAGSTWEFVTARGFESIGLFTAMVAFDGTQRLLAELFANGDRPDVRPEENYHKMFLSLRPGWTLNLKQIYWPDPAPRVAFLQGLEAWQNHHSAGLEILHRGLKVAVQRQPLPFLRRTILEFVLPGREGLAWWEGLQGLCDSYGVELSYLEAAEIRQIASRLFNPGFDE